VKSLIKLLLIELISFLLLACSSKDSAIKTEKLEPINIDSLILNQKPNKDIRSIFVHGKKYIPGDTEVKSLTMIQNDENIVEAELIGGNRAITNRIVYPEIAKRAKIQGTVAIEFDVDTLGYTRNFLVVKGIGGTCEEATIYALEETRFKPATKIGEPIVTRYRIILLFIYPEK